MALVQPFRDRVSFAELATWPVDGRRYELYDGEVREVASPLPIHQIVTGLVGDAMRAWARETGGLALCAPLDVVFTEYDVLQPDLLLFTAARRHLVRPRCAIRDRPDLVVEILSEGTSHHDRTRKLAAYARFGVSEYWIVNPETAAVDVLVLEGSRYALRQHARGDNIVESDVAQGLRFAVRSVFPPED